MSLNNLYDVLLFKIMDYLCEDTVKFNFANLCKYNKQIFDKTGYLHTIKITQKTSIPRPFMFKHINNAKHIVMSRIQNPHHWLPGFPETITLMNCSMSETFRVRGKEVKTKFLIFNNPCLQKITLDLSNFCAIKKVIINSVGYELNPYPGPTTFVLHSRNRQEVIPHTPRNQARLMRLNQ